MIATPEQPGEWAIHLAASLRFYCIDIRHGVDIVPAAADAIDALVADLAAANEAMEQGAAALEWASGGCTVEGWQKIGAPALAALRARLAGNPQPEPT